MNPFAWVQSRFEAFENRSCLIYGGKTYDYAHLLDRVKEWQDTLADLENRHGLAPGDPVTLVGDYAPETIFLMLALMFNGHIVIPLTPDVDPEKFTAIAAPKGCFRMDPRGYWDYTPEKGNPTKPELYKQLHGLGEPGVVIFTSGTTGESKGALLRPVTLVEKFREKIRRGYRTLIFLKLDHIGGINTLFSILLNGGTLITPGDRTPVAVCAAMDKYKVELLPTTPTFLNMVLVSGAWKEQDLSALKVITYGTEPMPVSTLESLNRCFPKVTFKQTYGLTELGIFSTQSKTSDSTWMKVGGQGIETKVKDGTLWVRSGAAMMGYLNGPNPFDEEGWYNTGDQVEMNGEYLRIKGRHEERINVGGEKVFPAEVESVLLELDNIAEVVVTGRKSPVTGQIVAATVALEQEEEPAQLRRRIHQHCKDKLARYKIPSLIQITSESLVSSRFKKIRSHT